MAQVGRSTKEEIVLAAERLFADRGINGVSLRTIGVAAGSGNNSVVQYHFGSKAQLIRAIFEYRLPRLHQRRALLIAETRPADLRAWLHCQIRAVLEQGELDDSHYMSFVSSLNQQGVAAVAEVLPLQFASDHQDYARHVMDHLAHLDEPLRSHRFNQAMMLIVHAAADRERARARNEDVLPFAVETANLVDAMVGFLEAPASEASRAAMVGVDAAPANWMLLPSRPMERTAAK